MTQSLWASIYGPPNSIDSGLLEMLIFCLMPLFLYLLWRLSEPLRAVIAFGINAGIPNIRWRGVK